MRFISLLAALWVCLASPAQGVDNSVPVAGEAVAADSVTQENAPADEAAAPVALESVDVLPPVAVDTAATAPLAVSLTGKSAYEPHHGMDWRMFKSVTNPETHPYKFLDDQTWIGVPLFFAGMIAKSEKTAFRQNYNNPNTRIRLIKYNFHNEIDNYTQYVPLALTIGLHLGGYEGRSDWPRFWASAAMSSAIMAGLVNGIKYTASEMRPDGSTRNSWPSGHTATAFLAATILHKEYGLTRSPWFSVGAYTLATATGVMRVLNNRHWVSDVLSGAGIGIMSVELGYGICDLLFKGRGLLRNDLNEFSDLRANPSFFSISMGMGFGNKHLKMPEFCEEDEVDEAEEGEYPLELKFRTSTVVGAEAAWFFNPYVGVGGRLRVKTTPINGWSALVAEEKEDIKEFVNNPDMQNAISDFSLTIESDHLSEFAADLGVYFSYPFSSRWAIGSKLLVGRSFMSDLDVTATIQGKEVEVTDPDAQSLVITDRNATGAWDYINLGASNSMKFGTGFSVTYAYKNSFSWRVFCDYDYCRKTFRAEYAPDGYMTYLSPQVYKELKDIGLDLSKPYVSRMKKALHQWVLGAALCISF